MGMSLINSPELWQQRKGPLRKNEASVAVSEIPGLKDLHGDSIGKIE